MRLRADIYVSALVRRVFSAGDFAAVEKKGAEEAKAKLEDAGDALKRNAEAAKDKLTGEKPGVTVEVNTK